jgi:NodT family efflux transporter outer membrane factor (OMF) lipoprotein
MRRALLSSASLMLAAAVLTGCAVGPDFVAPAAPTVAGYDLQPAPAATADGAQKLQNGQDIPAQWWGLFHSESLNRLIDQAIKNNPDLAAAEASLRVAEANLSAGGAELFPTVNASFSSQRQKTSKSANDGFAPSFTYTLHNASVGVSYGLDVFGGTRRAIEGLEAQADAARFEKEAVYLTLTANVVTAAIQDAALREQTADAQAIVGDEERILKIVEARFASGAVAKSAVVAQRTLLATARAAVPPLQHQITVNQHALAALLGQLPAAAPDTAFSLDGLTLPAELPLSLPAKLVEQRPDIRSARENLHAASAAIGVAEAARLPQITLSADIGSMANIFNQLFSPGNGFWNLGGSAAETLFDAGALADKEDAARAGYDASVAQYRKTVLAAFQDVADTLHALQTDAEVLNAKQDADRAAAENLALTQAQFAAGATDVAGLLTAERDHRQAALDLAQAKAGRYADTAALLTALGGGWWNRTEESSHD